MRAFELLFVTAIGGAVAILIGNVVATAVAKAMIDTAALIAGAR